MISGSQVVVVILGMSCSDIGLLQINSSWLLTLRPRLGNRPSRLDDP